jgi:hypothetical protein
MRNTLLIVPSRGQVAAEFAEIFCSAVLGEKAERETLAAMGLPK